MLRLHPTAQACAAGTPRCRTREMRNRARRLVVTTTQSVDTVLSSLDASREEFVEALQLMMTNTRLRERLGENGRQYIRQHHQWDAVLARLERLVILVRGR